VGGQAAALAAHYIILEFDVVKPQKMTHDAVGGGGSVTGNFHVVEDVPREPFLFIYYCI